MDNQLAIDELNNMAAHLYIETMKAERKKVARLVIFQVDPGVRANMVRRMSKPIPLYHALSETEKHYWRQQATAGVAMANV